MESAPTLFDAARPAGQGARCLFDALLRAESEQDAIAVMQSAGYWDDPDAWAVLGDEENNFSVASNQQTDPSSALVEKVINAIDARLMAGAYEAGVNPEGAEAPKGMTDAVECFFHVREGRLGDLTSGELGTLAKSIHVIATGPRDKPCYIIVDEGEGQTPESFPRTFLSVAKSNKLRIPFVQGKHNSGGLGVLQFCGSHNLQLVASRRHPSAPHSAEDSSADLWGFTVIRRQAPSDNRRASMYVYLAPGGRVPSFDAVEGVAVLPSTSGKQRPSPYSASIHHGTIIKLYEYRWRARSLATTEARFEFEKFLHAPCLPFRVTETRDYKANYYSTTVSGIWTAITAEQGAPDDDRKVETGYPAGSKLRLPAIGSLEYQIVVFRKDVDTRRVPYGVYFTVNGQVHGSLPADFVTRRLQFDYLRGYLFVSVDCSHMETMAREDFFMASRDRLRRNELYDALVAELESQLRSHPGLRALNAARRAAQLASTLDNQEDVLTTLDGILRHDPALRALFGLGDRLVSRVGPAEVEEYAGVRFPTYFRPHGTNQCKVVPRNRTCIIEFETDASNDYFDRGESPGRMTINPDVLAFGRLWNGVYLARLKPPDGCQPGDRVSIAFSVTDPDREANGRATFTATVELNVTKPDLTKHEPGGKKTPKQPANGRHEAPRLAIPNVVEVRRDAWNGYDPPFTEEEALRVKHSGEGGYDYLLNMDNRYLAAELRAAKPADHELVRYQFKWGLAICALGQIQYIRRQREASADVDDQETEQTSGDELDLVNATIGGIAMVIVPIVRNLFRGPQPN